MCHAAEVPGSPTSRSARCRLPHRGVTRKEETLLLIRSVYFPSGFVDDILNRCHLFIRALFNYAITQGLAHDRVHISAAIYPDPHVWLGEFTNSWAGGLVAFTRLVNPEYISETLQMLLVKLHIHKQVIYENTPFWKKRRNHFFLILSCLMDYVHIGSSQQQQQQKL